MKLFEFCFSLTVLCIAPTTTSGWLVGGGGGIPIPIPVPVPTLPTVPSFTCSSVEKYIGSALLKLILLPGFLPVISGTKIKITCKDGTQTSSGDSGFIITCVMWKGWQGKQECIPIKCNSLRNPTNGRIQFTAGTNYNSRARYTCNTGYRLPGSKAYLDRTCGKSGWSGSHYSCTVFNCGALSAPLYGAVNYNGATTYGKVATYTCDNSKGYVLSGSATRKCQNDGWSGSAPRCKLFDCQAPPAPANGAVSHDRGTTFGKVATYTCNRDRGYVLSGSATRTCQINEWSGSPPTCEIHICDTLTDPAHGTVRYLGGRKFGTVAAYSCDFMNGYVFSGSFTGRRTCTLNGWDGSDGTCELRNCGILRSPKNGGVNYSKGTTFGSVATYSCDQRKGYKLLGFDTSSCGLKGWDGTTPTCVRVECPLLQNPSNGKILYKDGLFFGSIALHSCDESKGYKLTGNDDRTCQFNGAWSGSAPKCEMKDCGNLKSPTNGGVTYSKGTTFGSVATYFCDQKKGYKLIGADTEKCELLGWIGTPPKCVRVECPMLLYPSNGAITYKDGYYFESVATYSCDERKGYKLTGSPTRACQFNGAWSPGRAPTCTLADCGNLNPPPNGDVSYSKGLTTFGQEATYSCDENKGYLLSGPDTRTCELAGWSGSAPKCKIKDCLNLPAPANGTVRMTLRGAELGMTTFGTEMTYSCDEAKGYKLSGSAKRKCQLDGWSGSAPTCNIVDCGNPIKPLNGYVKDTGTTFGETSKFACVKGYNLIGPNERKCEVNGEWSGVQPTCEIVDCGKNPNPRNGIVKHTGTTFGETADFECFEGYNLIGDKARICEFNGEWSGVKPICDVVECETLLPISNGYFRATGTTYDKTATFFCNVGYSITGNIQLKCQADGNWSGALPVCTIVDCGTPDAPKNGKVTYSDGTTYGDLAIYTCDAARGYKLPGSGTSYTRTCEPNKQWSGAVPTCNLVDCGKNPDPRNGIVKHTGTTFGETAEYECNKGHNLIGDIKRNCEFNGEWSGVQPICDAVQCDKNLLSISDGYVMLTGITYDKTATFFCNSGYSVTGNKELKCQADGNWSGALPVCTIMDCGIPDAPENGKVTYSDGTTYNNLAVYTCDAARGYKLPGSDTSYIRACRVNKLWSGAVPTCNLVDCGSWGPPVHGTASLQPSVSGENGPKFGAVVTYSCKEGYKIIGSATSTCQLHGWSDIQPICHIVDCQYLPPISNGTITYSGTTFRETATISCDEGYNLNGVAERTCEAGGQWSDAQPSCQIVDCQALPPLYMGSISYTGTTVYESATSSCDEGYKLSGDTERKCLPDGLWSGTETTCAIVDCNVLPPFNKGSITYTGTTFNEVATYSCDEGYKLLGDAERKCQVDGQWAGTLPKCESLPSDNSNPNAGCSVNDIIGIHDCQYNCYKQLYHLNADTEGKIYDTVAYASCLAFCYRQQVTYDNETLPLLPSPPSGSGTAGTERNFRSTLCYNKCLLAPSQYNGGCELAEYTIFTQCVAFCLLQREEVKLTISTVSVSSPGEMMIVQVEYLQCYVPCIRNYRQTAGPGCLSGDYIESTVCHGQCLAATEKVLQDRTKRQTPSVLPQTQLEEGRLSTVKCQAQCLLKLNKPSTTCIVDNLWLLNQCVNDCLFIIPINARLDVWGTNSMPV